MGLVRWGAVVAVLSLRAHAAAVSVEAAGGYSWGGFAQFQANLRVDQPLGEHVQIGVRSGVMLNIGVVAERGAIGSPPPTTSVLMGVPIDLGVRVSLGRFFLEPVGGPWFVFGYPPKLVLAHLGLGVGVLFGGFSLALEGGWLEPLGPGPSGALFLVRVGYRF